MTTCEYCGIYPVADNYVSTCEFCIYRCSTCGADTPYEDGVSSSSECGVCDTGSGMGTSVLDFVKVTNHMTEQTTTQKQGDNQMKNTLYTVVGFDDETKVYQVVGTTTSDIEPNDMVELLGKQDVSNDFENVIADFINAEVEQMVALATSKERAKGSGMKRAEHKPVVMRLGEWNSLIFALEKLREIDIERNDVHVACPTSRVSNGVGIDNLIDILKSSLESTKGVVGNA